MGAASGFNGISRTDPRWRDIDPTTGQVVETNPKQKVLPSSSQEEVHYGQLQINDIVFLIPPLKINIADRALNYSFDTLRSSSSVTVRSAKSEMIISIHMFFDGASSYSQLGTLIAQFKKTPFCYIENELIRAHVPMNENSRENIACAITNINLSPAGSMGMPEGIYAQIQMVYFNYKPFSANFTFRRIFDPEIDISTISANELLGKNLERTKDYALARSGLANFSAKLKQYNYLFTSKEALEVSGFKSEAQLYNSTADEVKDPRDSEAWRAFYNEGAKLPTLNRLTGDVNLSFTQIKPLTRGMPKNLTDVKESDLLLDVQRLGSYQEVFQFIPGPEDRLKPLFRKDKATDLLKLGMQFFGLAKRKIPVQNMFRTKADQEALGVGPWRDNTNSVQTSAHCAGTAFDTCLAQNLHWVKAKPGKTSTNVVLNEATSAQQLAIENFFNGKGSLPPEIREGRNSLGLSRQEHNQLKAAMDGTGFGFAEGHYGYAESWHIQIGGVPPGAVDEVQGENLKVEVNKTNLRKLIEELTNRKSVNGSMSDELKRQDLIYRATKLLAANSATSEHPEFVYADSSTERTSSQLQKEAMDFWLSEQKRQGDNPNYWKVVQLNEFQGYLERAEKETFRLGSGDLPVTGLQVTLTSNVVGLPLVGWGYPTAQYIGSTNASVSISLIVNGSNAREELKRLVSFLHAEQLQVLMMRHATSRLGIGIENDILYLCGIERVILDDLQTTTLDGKPETLEVNLSFTENKNSTKESFVQEEIIAESQIIQDAIKRVFDLAGGKFEYSNGPFYTDSDGWIEYSKSGTPPTPSLNLPLYGGGFSVGRSVDSSIETYRIDAPRLPISFTYNSSDTPGLDIDHKQASDLVWLLKESLKDFFAFDERTSSNYVKKLSRLPLLSFFPDMYGFQTALGIPVTKPRLEFLNFQETFQMKLKVWVHGHLLRDLSNFKDPEILAIAQKITKLNQVPSIPAYPDLHMPGNPLTEGKSGLLNPDFYFYNTSDIDNINGAFYNNIFNVAAIRMKDFYTSYTDKVLTGKVWEEAVTLDENVKGFSKTKTLEPPEGGLIPPQSVDSKLNPYNVGSSEKTKNEPVNNVGTLWMSNRTSEGSISQLGLSRNLLASTGRSGNTIGGKFDDWEALSILEKPYGESKDVPEGTPLLHDFGANGLVRLLQKDIRRFSIEDKLTMRRAFPTFKIYLIDSGTDELKTYRAFDDFYGVNSVKEIKVIKDKDLAADVAILQVLDLGGQLVTKTFRTLEELEAVKNIDNPNTNFFEKPIIKDGTKVQIRMGYENDPNNLDVVMNGWIASVEGTDVITFVCQSYGAELIAEEKGTDPKASDWDWNADTDEILSTLICSPEVKHFGRWTLQNIKPGGYEVLRPDGQVSWKWGFVDDPKDDNIFTTPVDNYTNIWDRWIGTRWKNWGKKIDYVLYHTTIWDVFQEMTLRHPGWIAAPVTYDDRMTMFFGVASQPYWYRGPKNVWEMQLNRFTEVYREQIGKVMKRREGVGSFRQWLSSAWSSWSEGDLDLITVGDVLAAGQYTTPAETNTEHDQIDFYTQGSQENLAKIEQLRELVQAFDSYQNVKASANPYLQTSSLSTQIDKEAGSVISSGLIKPFRDYHLVTSEHDIIDNSIRTDKEGTYNSIKVFYAGDVGFTDEGDQLSQGGSLLVRADDSIPEEHIRETYVTEPNCEGKHMAYRYGLGHLMKSLKDSYQGELVILGNPKIKPNDVCIIYDAYNDMIGPIEVKRIVHTFSKETGFISTITPELVVSTNELANCSVLHGIEHVMTERAVWLRGKTTYSDIQEQFDKNNEKIGEARSLGESIGTVAAQSTVALSAVGTGLGLASFATTAVAGTATTMGLLATFPIAAPLTLTMALVGGFWLLRVVQNRQQLMIHPLLKNGKPYIMGLDGYEMDGMFTVIGDEWAHFWKDSKDGYKKLQEGFESILQEYKAKA